MWTGQIPKEKWGELCDHLSQQFAGAYVDIELVHPLRGVQVKAEHAPFAGIAADIESPGDECIEVYTSDADRQATHTFSNPKTVQILDAGDAGETVRIQAKEGAVLVKLTPAVALPPPSPGIESAEETRRKRPAAPPASAQPGKAAAAEEAGRAGEKASPTPRNVRR